MSQLEAPRVLGPAFRFDKQRAALFRVHKRTASRTTPRSPLAHKPRALFRPKTDDSTAADGAPAIAITAAATDATGVLEQVFQYQIVPPQTRRGPGVKVSVVTTSPPQATAASATTNITNPSANDYYYYYSYYYNYYYASIYNLSYKTCEQLTADD